jgi:cell division protein FtsB
MCSREIVRLKAENRALKKQHAQLEEERDRLTKELGRVGDRDYIKEQARKQLRLLDPGEKMFVFEDGEVSSEDEAAAQEAEKDGKSSGETEETEEENTSDE